MQLTDEQRAVIESGDQVLKINAVAGSGKTTTLLEYAARHRDRRILYLVYNKSVADEVRLKVAERALHHVTVSTIHALAYRHTNAGRFQLEHELNEWRLLDGYLPAASRQSKEGLLLGWLLKELLNYYLNSSHTGLDEALLQRYAADTAPQSHVADLLRGRGSDLLETMRRVLADMRAGEFPAVHDFYLKLFQFLRHPLPYDAILVDEAQDTSGVMLSVVARQPAIQVYVGDTFQQIYGFRYAVNSLEQISAPDYRLSRTFRFGDGLARHLSAKLNSAYSLLGEDKCLTISGNKEPTWFGAQLPKDRRPVAVISRSNLALFEACIERLLHTKDRFHFQGGYQSYSFLNRRVASALFLSQGRVDQVQDPLLQRFANFGQFKEFVEQTQTQSLANIIGLVERFGGKLFDFDRSIKQRLADPDQADVIFTTTHKAKGQEYAHVEMLSDDFITRAELRKASRHESDEGSTVRLVQEVNVYYVAATRARTSIDLAEF
jgi:superfamily I DNA/RNA helicase